ncbi:ribose ABC transporter substrate-binding protein [Actinoplanes sp. ATCC 53533]|uniref:sugar ABC transporter substrate-binding protein n=1 Tax=Actinoplanes sp. ATCC 53533 TaxID=1288362 RepID=UPI000F793DBC|nr:sugar ABC transporter substrate-binding protein [Actinoplanes sp. ATCC 53533]RSM64285.1 ribose ABC transporter substrate-binding protein [Actinoplanes sp. ATCC 53533]
MKTDNATRLGAFLTAGLLALTSCSSGDSTTAGSGGCETATSKLNLAFVYAATDQNPFQEMALGAKAAADADGNVKLNEVAPTSVDGPKAVALFQAASKTATDGIAYQTVTPDLFVRPLNEATSDKTPVIAVDAAPPAGTSVKTYIGNSNTALGVLLGEAFVKQNPPASGEVVLGNDIPSLPLLVQRLDGVQSVIKSKLPGMKVSGPFDAKSQPTENYNAWKSLSQAHPEAAAFIGVGGQDGVSLPLIKKQTGRTFLAGSADLPPEAVAAVQSGSVFALSSPEHWMKGYVALHLLIQSKRTCTPVPEGWWNSGNLLVDKSNVESIAKRQASPESRTAYFQAEIAKQLANPPIKPLSEAN